MSGSPAVPTATMAAVGASGATNCQPAGPGRRAAKSARPGMKRETEIGDKTVIASAPSTPDQQIAALVAGLRRIVSHESPIATAAMTKTCAQHQDNKMA